MTEEDVAHSELNSVKATTKVMFKQLFNGNNFKDPISLTSALVTVMVTLYLVWCLLFSGTFTLFQDEIFNGDWWAVTLVVIFGFLLILSIFIIFFQPRSRAKLPFAVRIFYKFLKIDSHFK